MSEIPMPGDYGQAETRAPKSEGFCSQCCETSCKAILSLIIIAVIILFFVFMMMGGFFFF